MVLFSALGYDSGWLFVALLSLNELGLLFLISLILVRVLRVNASSTEVVQAKEI